MTGVAAITDVDDTQPIERRDSVDSASTTPRPVALHIDLDDAFSTGDDDDEDFSLARLSLARLAESANDLDHGEGAFELHDITLTPHDIAPTSDYTRNGEDPTGRDQHSLPLSSTPPDKIPLGHSVPISLSRPSTDSDVLSTVVDPSDESESEAQFISISLERDMSTQSAGYLTPTHDTSTAPSTPRSLEIPRPRSVEPSKSPRTPSTPRHRPARSTGKSTLESVLSKTRPTHLPPKNREEDQKHLKDWKVMMEQSHASEERRKKTAEERKRARERAVDETTHIWEKEILPDWKVVRRNPNLRATWWEGIPTRLRGRIWALAIGNGLALSKNAYTVCLARAKRYLSSRSFPAKSLDLIEQDIAVTLPNLHIFHPDNGPLYQDLKDVLLAWTVARGDEGLSYVTGTASIAGLLLLNIPADQAFIALRNLLERHCLRAFWGGVSSREDVLAYYRIFDTLLSDGMPKVYYNFKQHQVPPSEYLRDWIMALFLHHLPLDACLRIWDVIVLEGDSFLFRAAIAILGVIESRLYYPDRTELLEVLRGENKAAIEVAKRMGIAVDVSARYEQYGMTEESLWERIHAMEEWWRETTWSRLIQRELPDI